MAVCCTVCTKQMPIVYTCCFVTAYVTVLCPGVDACMLWLMHRSAYLQ
jgi:hypothetical protein